MERIQLYEVSPEELAKSILKGVDQRLEAITSLFQSKEREEYLTRQETAKYLSIDLSTLYHYTKAGKLPSYGIANRVYYKLSDIEAALIPLNNGKRDVNPSITASYNSKTQK